MNKKPVPKKMVTELDHTNRTHDFERITWTEVNEYHVPPAPVLRYWRNGIVNEDRPLPTEEMWQQFLTRIEEIGVFDWKSEKIPEFNRFRDGSNGAAKRWRFEIYYQDGTEFKVSGLAKHLPPRFDEFCEAASNLLSGQIFGKDLE